MHYHHQNLDNRPGDGHHASGHLWRHGRAWLRPRGDRGGTIGWEWVLFRFSAHLELRVGEGISVSFAIPFLLTLYVTFEPRWGTRLSRFCQRFDWYHLGARIHSWALWVDLWADGSCWSGREGFWHRHRRRFSVNFPDVLFGRTRYEKRSVRTTPITVPMPEGSYKGTAEFVVGTWTRPRFPFWPLGVTRRLQAHVEMQEPVPFPGKGENSWDCGEDALHGLSTNVDQPRAYEAVAAVVESVMRSRERYGGPNWRPARNRGVDGIRR